MEPILCQRCLGRTKPGTGDQREWGNEVWAKSPDTGSSKDWRTGPDLVSEKKKEDQR